MTRFDALSRKIARRDLTCGIIGLGYVGLPLAAEMAGSGLRVIGFDVAERVVDGVNRGESHIKDVPGATIAELRRRGGLEASRDMTRLAECDVVSICVPTPLGKTKDPDMSFVLAATQSVADALRPAQLVVLESTTYPGTTRELMQPMLEAGGLKCGEDFFLCFSPERVDPGNTRWFVKNTPKVIGGITDRCTELGASVYGIFIDSLVRVSSPEAAELTKLLENTFRMINIGLANEMAQVCDKLGVDVWEVIDAASTKPFGFMRFTPGPGLGGHCIPLDPHYLAWKMRGLNYKTRFIDLAGELNTEMPAFWVRKVADALNDSGKAVRGSSVLVLGVAYKKDIDDLRESPALDIIRLLEQQGAKVAYHDPWVPEFQEDGHHFRSTPLSRESVAGADCVIIVTDHSSLDYELIRRHGRAIVDTRNALGRRSAS